MTSKAEQQLQLSEQFFHDVGDLKFRVQAYGDIIWHFEVEELYQHFKARMLAEIKANNPPA